MFVAYIWRRKLLERNADRRISSPVHHRHSGVLGDDSGTRRLGLPSQGPGDWRHHGPNRRHSSYLFSRDHWYRPRDLFGVRITSNPDLAHSQTAGAFCCHRGS